MKEEFEELITRWEEIEEDGLDDLEVNGFGRGLLDLIGRIDRIRCEERWSN